MFVSRDEKVPQASVCRRWNDRYAGEPAFTALNGAGYSVGRVFRRGLRAHRVAWAIYYGEHPKHEIDHKDGVRSNNAIKNLRDVPRLQNAKNICRPTTNTSGQIGVSRRRKNGRWHAYIDNDGKRISLGYFCTLGEAAKARKLAEKRLGYHENHGRD